jgi:small conductance mechanosensitive channel
MPAMPELPVLTPAIEILLQVALVVIVVIVAIVLLRQAVRVAVRGILERRAAERDGATIAPVELERRVNTIARLVLRVGAATIGVMGLLMVLGIFDIDVGPAVAGLGVVGIAVGFGAQTLIRDWLAGVFIVLENQYNEGDVVRIAGVDGVVESFGLRRTTLRDADGTLHTVPNGQITVSSNMTRTRDAAIAGAPGAAPLPPSTGASQDSEATDPNATDATAPVGPQR